MLGKTKQGNTGKSRIKRGVGAAANSKGWDEPFKWGNSTERSQKKLKLPERKDRSSLNEVRRRRRQKDHGDDEEESHVSYY